VKALDTSADTIGVTAEVARRMGKETVVVKDSAGFITSRINAMIGNEAFLPAPLLVQHVKAGRLGKKAGRGVYDYRGLS
jgi:3-hydroxyacyl-CoA dehydrogenase